MSASLLAPSLILFLVGLFAGLAASAAWLKARHTTPEPVPEGPVTHELHFDGDMMTDACPAARAILSPDDLDSDPMARLTTRLGELFPQFNATFEAARADGVSFELSEATTSGPVHVAVTCEGPRTTFRLTGLPDILASRVLVNREIVEADRAELAVLRSTVSTGPTVIWREDKRGAIDWVNTAYMDLTEQAETNAHSGWPPKRLLDGASVTPAGQIAQPRRSPLTLKDGTTRWFDITSHGHGSSTLHYANDASKTIHAEEALRNFTQTLTQTFASLPIGLAIFDRQRQMQLFNPALLDLTTLEPEWLIARPTLYDFINRLREKRMLPERRDFTDWRAKINELEKLAVNGTYLETWNLPTGQTYKVTGRPHPEGAVAFLIEDISAEVSLTRKFRRELEVSQSLLDCLPEAIAVFDAHGNLSLSNGAYCQLWEHDPELVMDQIGIVEATRQWQQKSLPTPLWGDVREFVCHAGDRTEWFGSADMENGQQLACRFVPLAGGATMVSFQQPDPIAAPMKELARIAT